MYEAVVVRHRPTGMRLHLTTVSPTGRDIVRCSIFALGLVALGNMYQSINYYIFKPAARPAPQTTHDLMVTVMARIDAYQPSATIITFLFWGLVGLGVLALCQGLAHALRRVSYLQFASSRYGRHLHTQPLSRWAFWKQWIITAIGSFMAFTTALFIFSFFVLCIVPVGIVYTRIFIYSPTPFNLVYALMGVVMTFIGLVLTTIGVRLIIARRRLIRLA